MNEDEKYAEGGKTITEIEKSMLGMKDQIDLNGQAKEICILLDAIGNAILKSRNGDGHKVNEKNINTLAVYIMEAINDYVYKLDPKKSTMPIIIAGVASWVELMRGTLDEKETEETANMIEAVVNSSIVYNEEKGEDDEENDEKVD